MKITIKNYELLNIYSALNTIMSHKLPVSIGYYLTKNSVAIKSTVEVFIKSEQDLVSEYAIKKDGQVLFKDDGQPEIQPKYKDTFVKEHNELLNCDNEIDLATINLSSILYTYVNGKKVEREVEPTLLFALDKMIINDMDE